MLSFTLWLLAAVQLTLLLDFMVLMPLGAELMDTFGLSPARFGAIVSSYTLASAGASLAGGFWLDRVARRTSILWLYALFILASLGCALASSALWLLLARVLAGAAAGLLFSSIMALVVDQVPVARRGAAIATLMTSYAISAVAGVPVGLFLSAWFGVQAPFYAVALLSALLWLVVLATLRPGEAVAEPGAERAGTVLAQPACVLGFLLSFCVVFAGFLLIPYLGTFMQRNLGLGTADLPWVYASGGLFTLVSSRVTGRLVDRLGPARVLLALLLATAIPHLAFTHLQEASLLRVCGWFVLFMGLTAVRIIPTLALITSALPAHARGRFMALNTAVTDLATALATWLGGALLAERADGALIGFDKLGYLAVLTSSGAVLVLWLVRRAQVREPVEARPRAREQNMPAASKELKALVE